MTGYLRHLLDRRYAARTANRTVDWLLRHQHHFSIAAETAGAIPWRVKPLAELMFLLTVLKRHEVSHPSLSRLCDRALTEGSTFDWHELAAYDPSAATIMGVVADFFCCHRAPAPFDGRFFTFLHTVDYFEGMDRLPFRDMDLAYCLSRVIAPAYEQALPVWFRSTAFGRGQHIVRYSIDDIYSLTHAVFYLTDLGLRTPASLLDRETVARLQTEIVLLTGTMLRADNTDVLGELLLCWLWCGVDRGGLNGVIFEHGLDRMMTAETLGSIAPTASILDKARAGSATFDQLYHTTLVGALLFNLLVKA